MSPFILPGSYVFRGSYLRDDSVIPRPIEGSFEVSFSGGKLSLEGVRQQHSGRPRSPFKFEANCDVDGLLAPVVASISPGQLNGWAAIIPNGFSALLNNVDQTSLSVHATRSKDRVHAARGQLIRTGDRPASFEILIAPAESELALENVVALRDRREI